jgi:predicted ATP-grasp superfamily ATP-dependent carboligase
MSQSLLEIDRSTPALIVKVGQYPLHSGGVGAIRTLGRLDVPVYAMTENGFTPAALSRYLKGRFLSRATGQEEPEQLVIALRDIGRRLGRKAVVIPTDDEAAVLIAEHASELSDLFFFPQISPGLPRKLASKWFLYELCRKHGIPAPVSVCAASRDEVTSFAAQCEFPVVAKNAETWMRLRTPVVSGTTVLHAPEELLALALPADGSPGVILQEYIPRDQSQDWIVHLYCDANSNCVVLFTGVKLRSWPPDSGPTACAYTLANPELAQIAERFCKAIAFRGIADLDWRLDLRDGKYKLVDFNPRVGNQFRLYETTAGIDVVRALHLDLTGRAVPVGQDVKRRQIVVEHFDLPARLAYRRVGSTELKPERAPTELAWLAADDPIPFLRMLISRPSLRIIIRMSRSVVTEFISALRKPVLTRWPVGRPRTSR